MARIRQQRKRIEPTAVPAPNRAWLLAIAAAALAAFIVLAAGDILTSSPTSDETAHLVAGYSYLVAHDYRLNPEHPPLLKTFAALPMLAMRVWPARLEDPADGKQSFAMFHESWVMALPNPAAAEWSASQYLLYGLRDSAFARVGGDPARPRTDVAYARSDFLNDPDHFFTAARLMMLLIGVALAATIFWWSARLWGLAGGVLSLLLFCLDPNFIAHSGLVTTDVGAACLIFMAAYFFWRACREATAMNVALFAITFALAQIAKFSAILLIPMLLLTGIIEIVRSRQWRAVTISLGAAAVATVFVVWAAYDFRFSAVPDPRTALAEEQAVRANLQLKVLDAPNIWPTGYLPLRDALDQWNALKRLRTESPNGYTFDDLRNAKRTTRTGLIGRLLLFADAHHLLPESFIYGFAWTGTTSVTRPSYLKGEYSGYGFPSYFFWTFLYKTPIPAIVLIVAGVIAAIRSRRRDLAFLVWPCAVFGVFAFTASIHIGHRHVFPMLPFVYTMAGSLGAWWASRAPRVRAISAAIVVAALAIAANVSLLPRPASLVNRHLSYLNEIAGGPVAGWDKLTDSNFDWGQDVKRLAGWLREHHVDEPIDMVVFGNADPRYYGIRYNNLRLSDYPLPQNPGYVAISQADYLGLLFDRDHRTYWRDFLARAHARRVGTAGYTIFIYKIDQLP